MVSLKQLNYVLAVDKTRHFKRAADACAVSQSALSTAVAELENQLGVQIFERNNKQVLVTPLGRQLLDKARQIALLVDDLQLLAQSDKAPLSHPIRIGVIPTIGPYLLPKVLPLLHEQYPQLRLTLIEDQSSVLADKVRSGELDTAILALPYPTEGLHSFEFWAEDFLLVTHKANSLARKASVSGADLEQGKLLLLSEGHCLKDHALAACSLPANESERSLSGTSLYTLVQMVAGRMGSTLVPEMARSQLVATNDALRLVPLSEKGPHRRIAFITRLNYSGVHNIERLKDMFREQLLAERGSN